MRTVGHKLMGFWMVGGGGEGVLQSSRLCKAKLYLKSPVSFVPSGEGPVGHFPN